MSVVCDRPVMSSYNNVRQGKRKELERDQSDIHHGRFYFSNLSEEDQAGSRSDQSSIGEESDSDCASNSSINSSLFCVEEGEEEVESSKGGFGFGSFDSLEESLPIKRGLSNFFSGKSKSFACLSNVASSTVSDLVKPENPFNKRRRILLACTRRASYSSLISYLPPLLSPEHTVEEETEDQDEKQEKFENNNNKNNCVNTVKLKTSLISPRSYSLSDLQHV